MFEEPTVHSDLNRLFLWRRLLNPRPSFIGWLRDNLLRSECTAGSSNIKLQRIQLWCLEASLRILLRILWRSGGVLQTNISCLASFMINFNLRELDSFAWTGTLLKTTWCSILQLD